MFMITFKKRDVCLDNQTKRFILLKYDLAIKSSFKLIRNLSELLEKGNFQSSMQKIHYSLLLAIISTQVGITSVIQVKLN